MASGRHLLKTGLGGGNTFISNRKEKSSQHLRPTGVHPAYAYARCPQDLRLAAIFKVAEGRTDVK